MLRRREFIGSAVLFGITATLPNTRAASPVPRRKLGRTGETISGVGIGGAHLGGLASDAEAVSLVRRAIDEGIDFLDNCWDYHGGKSEERMGQALRDGYRERAFLMTKIDGRDARTATRQIEESLRRLGTDRLDLLQLHEVIHDDDPERAFAPKGAIEAMQEAQRQGKARWLGFTGHKSPALHLRMLDAAQKHGFRFDAVQLPLNVLDAHYDSFERLVLPRLVAEDIGVLGMKSMGNGLILASKAASASECLRYAMSLPTSVVITGIDSPAVLDQALEVARAYTPLTDAEREALLGRTARFAERGAWEKYKTSRTFDSTSRHPEWLGPG
ncbi:MAG: aldo/keto reductase [Pseudomonadota bacterium]|nr:aldo/keto reductase [Pseudomonadota bacterium]